MRQIFLRHPRQMTRILEILIPGCSWLLITMPVWLSFWHPALVAYLVVLFNVYWFYKSGTLAYHAIRSFLTLNAHSRINWKQKAQTLADFDKVHHIIIIPEYKEPIHILKRTLTNLSQLDYPLDKLIVVLATEAQDPESKEVSQELAEIYSKNFGKFFVTSHQLAAGEITGKSSNMASAAKTVVTKLSKDRTIKFNMTTVTSCDADALIHPQYFGYLTHQFLTDKEREFHFYQGAILFYSNIWRIPLPNRFINTLNSIWNLATLSQSDRLINFSTYSLPLSTAISAGYWGPDVIPEDYHMFFRVYFSKGERVRTRPIFLPILVDAAQSHGFFRTMINQYEQAKRWAWGVSDIPFVIRGMFLHPTIPRLDRVKRLTTLLEHHIFWPANWFILTLGSSLPPLVNPAFGRTVLGHNISQISSGILTLSTVFLLVVFYIDWRMKPPRPADIAAWKVPFLYLQWLTLPIISFFLSALPGLDAHTRLMLGKRMEYRVTEKI